MAIVPAKWKSDFSLLQNCSGDGGADQRTNWNVVHLLQIWLNILVYYWCRLSGLFCYVSGYPAAAIYYNRESLLRTVQYTKGRWRSSRPSGSRTAPVWRADLLKFGAPDVWCILCGVRLVGYFPTMVCSAMLVAYPAAARSRIARGLDLNGRKDSGLDLNVWIFITYGLIHQGSVAIVPAKWKSVSLFSSSVHCTRWSILVCIGRHIIPTTEFKASGVNWNCSQMGRFKLIVFVAIGNLYHLR